MSAKEIASKFYEELAVTKSSQGLKDFIKKHYDEKVVQYEAGQPVRDGLDAVMAAETVFFDQYLDWKATWPAKWVEVHSLFADGDTTFSEQSLTMPLNGMGTVVQRQLVETRWDLKTGKVLKECFADYWTWTSGSNSVITTNSKTSNPDARKGAASWKDSNGNLLLFGGQTFSGEHTNDLWKFDGNKWVCISKKQTGNYDKQGATSSRNYPGARHSASCSVDSNGNAWIYGGNGYTSLSQPGFLSDLWKFDGTYWIWISGKSTLNSAGEYGTKGIPSSSNFPGARYMHVSWIDSKNTLWIFGGLGMLKDGMLGALNDLWKYDGMNWTWISGSNSMLQKGNYGNQGVADVLNIPGARQRASSWIDSKDNIWLFGGFGIDFYSIHGILNDLWKYDGENWIWISGSNKASAKGIYGVQGLTAPSNTPSPRCNAFSWIDSRDNIWLFGGSNCSSFGEFISIFNSLELYNDLWRFTGTYWTWISGSDVPNESGKYGTLGEGDNLNTPGAREDGASWIDSKDNIWLFGGTGFAHSRLGTLNYLWVFGDTEPRTMTTGQSPTLHSNNKKSFIFNLVIASLLAIVIFISAVSILYLI